MQALDLARGALSKHPDSAGVRYLGALACARMGADDEAEAWLAKINCAPLGTGGLAVDVASLGGRIAKQRFTDARKRGSADAAALGRAAIDAYEHAFALAGDAYPAVNAATLAMLAGDAARASALAHAALTAIGTPSDHWQHASLAEALLVIGRDDDARTHYAAAHRIAGARFGDIASMRRQLRMIGSPAAMRLLDVVPAPRVIAFSGHMIDGPGRVSPRFPPALEARVEQALRAAVARLGPALGYAQAACGGDILFLEAMQDAGWQTQIVLPFGAEAFIDTSVRFAGASWVERFERVLARATGVRVATDEPYLGDDVLFEHAATLIQGLAFLRARDLETDALLLNLRDEEGPVRLGGAMSTAALWARSGGAIETIDLAGLRGASRPPTPVGFPVVDPNPGVSTERRRSLRSLLFADVSGYSRMAERYTPDFAAMFLGISKRILDTLERAPAFAQTQGDGLFLAFDHAGDAASFAVSLQASLRRVDWSGLGLAQDTGARVGLHTGPVFRIHDPVTGRFTFYGAHVNRTARLEPIVRPGHIFATEDFAASLVASNDGRFRCDYIGETTLAKGFGTARLYRVRGVGQPL